MLASFFVFFLLSSPVMPTVRNRPWWIVDADEEVSISDFIAIRDSLVKSRMGGQKCIPENGVDDIQEELFNLSHHHQIRWQTFPTLALNIHYSVNICVYVNTYGTVTTVRTLSADVHFWQIFCPKFKFISRLFWFWHESMTVTEINTLWTCRWRHETKKRGWRRGWRR